MAFDFVGFGETGGSIHESSLQKRTEQACAMIEAMNIKSPICLLGSSMGAYTAVKLSEILPTNGIILFVPAMYDLAAYSAPFGDEFSQIIRKPNSWVNSDAWQILQAFRGRLLVVAAGQDDVIPQDVIRRIDEAAANTSWKEVYTVQHSSHMLIQYLEQNPSEFDHVVGLIQHCVKGK